MYDFLLKTSKDEKEAKKRMLEIIRANIHFREKRRVLSEINCYAYALGIDMKESEIFKYAYNLGVIGKRLSNISIIDKLNIDHLCFEDKFKFDLDILGIDYEQIDLKDASYVRNRLYENIDTWVIAMYVLNRDNVEEDFHFIRRLPSGIWTHKLGRNSENIAYSFDIKDYISLNEDEKPYEQVGIYKLSLKR